MKDNSKAIRFVARIHADTTGTLPKTMELARSGDWHTPWHGDFELSSEDFAEAVAHFKAGVYRVEGTEPLSAGFNHAGHGGAGPASFRITNIYTQPNDTGGVSLMADITWTASGREALERDDYRYVSFEYQTKEQPLEDPEKAGSFIPNVLTGATLTNDPLFKKLRPVMASVGAGGGKESNKGEPMKLEDLRAKDPSTLTEDEKKFVTEHKAELTDEERTKFELKEDPKDPIEPVEPKDPVEPAPKDPVEPKEPADPKLEASAQPVQITKGQLEKLEAAAKAGLEAKAQLDLERTQTQVKAHVAAGRIKSDQATEVTSVLLASAPALRTRLEKLFASLPENKMVTGGEQGADGTDTEAADAVDREVKSLMASAKLSYGSALSQVRLEKPELYADYQKELRESN